MRLTRRLPLLAVFAPLAASGPAVASDHVMRISEVLLSNGGDTASQFIELFDSNNESFPNDPYAVAIYDADGEPLGSVAIDPPAGTGRYIVSTATADDDFAFTGDDTLDVTLPTDGQVCFERNGTKIHCLAWGCVGTPLGGNRNQGASPGDGMSLSRQPGGDYHLTTPSPDEANPSGVAMTPCPGGLPDAGAAGAADAGTSASPDAGSGGDGDGDDGEDDGCGCQAVGRHGLGTWLLLALAATFTARRRRA